MSFTEPPTKGDSMRKLGNERIYSKLNILFGITIKTKYLNGQKKRKKPKKEERKKYLISIKYNVQL